MGFEALTREAPARSRSNWPTSEGEGVCEIAAGRTEGGGREEVWGCQGGGGMRLWFSVPVLFHNAVTKETRLIPEPCTVSCPCLCDRFSHSARVCVCVSVLPPCYCLPSRCV